MKLHREPQKLILRFGDPISVKFVLCTSEVKFAHHFAVRRNFTHEVNFTCPKGKLSFSVFSVKDNTLRCVAVLKYRFFRKNIKNPRNISSHLSKAKASLSFYTRLAFADFCLFLFTKCINIPLTQN